VKQQLLLLLLKVLLLLLLAQMQLSGCFCCQLDPVAAGAWLLCQHLMQGCPSLQQRG
jgi:hypothetical protein